MRVCVGGVCECVFMTACVNILISMKVRKCLLARQFACDTKISWIDLLPFNRK